MRTGPETAAVAPELVTLIEAMCASPAEAVRTRSVLSSLMAFGSARGITSTAELFDRDVIEAFCLRGCGHLDVRTRATYRWVCRRLAEEIVGDSDDDRRATPLAAVAALAPYSPAERAALVAVAAAQRDPAKRASALALCCGGIGAGLRAAELVGMRGHDLLRRAGGVEVIVDGPYRRVVPINPPYDEMLAALAADAGSGFVFRPTLARRHYKNAVNDFVGHLVADPAAPRWSVHRARSSFVCDHLAAATPLATLMVISGIVCVESLARYARWVPDAPQTKAALRCRLGDGLR